MNYDAIYKTMQNTTNDFYNAAKTLDGYIQRLDNVKNQLGTFSGLAEYKNSVTSQALAVSSAAAEVIQTGQCLDNARIDYLLAEQQAYQLISGDTSFNIGDGVSAVAVPDLKGEDDRSLWDKIWGGVTSTIGNAVKCVTESISAIKQKISPGGDWYTGWQVVKSVGSVVSGALAIASGNPLLMLYGANSIVMGVDGIIGLVDGHPDAIDNINPLKAVMEYGSTELGFGKEAGDILYFAGDVATIVTGFNDLGGSGGISDVMNLDVDSHLYSNIDTVINAFYGYGNSPVHWFYDLYDTSYSAVNAFSDFDETYSLAAH